MILTWRKHIHSLTYANPTDNISEIKAAFFMDVPTIEYPILISTLI